MSTFLSNYMRGSGMGAGVWDSAIAAGYSPKQIAVASHKQGAPTGGIFNQRRSAAAQAASSNPYNWIHNYAGGSGGVGMTGLQSGLASGKTVDQMTQAASGLHMSQNWGVPGFGRDASEWILNNQSKEEQALRDKSNAQYLDSLNQAMLSAQRQFGEMLANQPKPTSASSQGYSTNPASAGLTIRQNPIADSGGVDELKRKPKPKKKPDGSPVVLPGNQVNTGTQG